MDKINYLLSGLEDMDKVIVFLKKDAGQECQTRKMIFRKEETGRFPGREIFKVDGYISRFDSDLHEDFILLNVPDIWFWNEDQSNVGREEDYDMVFIPKKAVQSIHPTLETIIKRFVKELKYEV
jgi:hypothetical protein